ncbi:hypothetical protein RJI07_04935 [Mycoplasmatota bacterium WC30]
MIGIVILVALILLFIGTTVLNNRTEVPEECRDLKIDKCSGCLSYSCEKRK